MIIITVLVVPEDTEVDEGDDDDEEAAEQDVDDAGGVVHRQVYVRARVEKTCLIPLLLIIITISCEMILVMKAHRPFPSHADDVSRRGVDEGKVHGGAGQWKEE